MGSLRAGLSPCSPEHPPPLPAAIPAATTLPTPTPMLHNLPLPRRSSGHQWGNNRQRGRVGSRAQAGCPRRCNPPALGADAAGPALDLAVHVGKARVVGFGLVGADLQAGGRGAKVRVWPQVVPAAPMPGLSPATTVAPSSWWHWALTGHLVMSSGHTWGGLDAGSSHVLAEGDGWGVRTGLAQHIPSPRLVTPLRDSQPRDLPLPDPSLAWEGSCTLVSYSTPITMSYSFAGQPRGTQHLPENPIDVPSLHHPSQLTPRRAGQAEGRQVPAQDENSLAVFPAHPLLPTFRTVPHLSSLTDSLFLITLLWCVRSPSPSDKQIQGIHGGNAAPGSTSTVPHIQRGDRAASPQPSFLPGVLMTHGPRRPLLTRAHGRRVGAWPLDERRQRLLRGGWRD